jgi:hypothetical protein
VVKISYRKDPLDKNSALDEGMFHGFFQESLHSPVFALLHSATDPEGIPFKFYHWRKALYFNYHSDPKDNT